jgi:eukaryotic-like serine/threonine-protein kinase
MASRPEGLSVGVTPDKPKKSPWIRLVAVGAAVMGATLGTALVIMQGPSGSTNPEPAMSAAPPIASAPVAVPKQLVLVVVEPPNAGATAVLGTERIKFPKNIEVEQGKPVKLDIEAKGFETKKVTIDGTAKELTIKLVAIPGTAPQVPETPTGRPTSAKSGSTSSPTTTTTTNKPPSGSDVVDIYGPTQPGKPKQ